LTEYFLSDIFETLVGTASWVTLGAVVEVEDEGASETATTVIAAIDRYAWRFALMLPTVRLI